MRTRSLLFTVHTTYVQLVLSVFMCGTMFEYSIVSIIHLYKSARLSEIKPPNPRGA